MAVERILASVCVLGLGMLTARCGSQIGDPNGEGVDGRLTESPSSLGTLVNATFLQTIDSINMGDYAYSRVESRVSTDRACQQAGSKLSLVDKAESNHSVIDEATGWSAKSDLSIKRSYQDAWTQNSVLLACNASAKTVAFAYERLQQGTIRLQSQVDEDLTRALNLSEKQIGQTIQHTLTLEKSGQRTLDFVDYQENGREVQLAVELRSQLSSSIKFPATDTNGAPTSATVIVNQTDRFPLEFLITIDQSDQWTRYAIPTGQAKFELPQTGEELRLEFHNLVFTRAGGCVPTAGELTAMVVHSDQTSARYTLSFQTKGPLLMRREGSSDALLLAPFACVLKER